MKSWLYYAAASAFLAASVWFYKWRSKKLAAELNKIKVDHKALQARVIRYEEAKRAKQERDKAREQDISTVVDPVDPWDGVHQRDEKDR